MGYLRLAKQPDPLVTLLHGQLEAVRLVASMRNNKGAAITLLSILKKAEKNKAVPDVRRLQLESKRPVGRKMRLEFWT